MSNNNSGAEAIVIFIIVLVIGAACVGVGIACGEKGMRREAVAHNAAHYEVNPTTGETKFVWNNKAEDTQ